MVALLWIQRPTNTYTKQDGPTSHCPSATLAGHLPHPHRTGSDRVPKATNWSWRPRIVPRSRQPKPTYIFQERERKKLTKAHESVGFLPFPSFPLPSAAASPFFSLAGWLAGWLVLAFLPSPKDPNPPPPHLAGILGTCLVACHLPPPLIAALPCLALRALAAGAWLARVAQPDIAPAFFTRTPPTLLRPSLSSPLGFRLLLLRPAPLPSSRGIPGN